jgi:hypothetical protein
MSEENNEGRRAYFAVCRIALSAASSQTLIIASAARTPKREIRKAAECYAGSQQQEKRPREFVWPGGI